MGKTLIQTIAATLNAFRNCGKTGNTEWRAKHREHLKEIDKLLPHGSGFDAGTTICLTPIDKNVYLFTSFHHMDENGSYDGWTNYDIIVAPAFEGIDIEVLGEDKNGIKECIAEVFHDVLTANVEVLKTIPLTLR